MKQERVTLSQTELRRVLVLQKVLDGHITVQEAAVLLGLSTRQVKRLKKRLKLFGPESLAHGNRGRKPAHTIPDHIRQLVVELAQTKYRGCNDTYLSELLGEHEGIRISPSSVRRILRAAGIPSPRKHRPRKVHRRRPRKAQLGMLVLIDGSQHDWLEGRGPILTLLAAVDDATGRILAALFWPSEDFDGYCRLLHTLVVEYGIPVAIYTDRHTLFVSPRAEQDATLEHQLLGQQRPLTQLGRILSELGIQHIVAHSPQAKGRIERVFGTLQQRLVLELRLAGASTLEEANAVLQRFIPRYNQQFAVEPAEAEPAFRPIPAHLQLEHIFCWKEPRTLNPGGTIQYNNQTYLVLMPRGVPPIPVRTVVAVHRYPDGRLCVGWNGRIYPLQPFNDRPAATPSNSARPACDEKKEEAGTTRTPHKPASNHPWRRAFARRPVDHNTTTVTKSLTRIR